MTLGRDDITDRCHRMPNDDGLIEWKRRETRLRSEADADLPLLKRLQRDGW